MLLDRPKQVLRRSFPNGRVFEHLEDGRAKYVVVEYIEGTRVEIVFVRDHERTGRPPECLFGGSRPNREVGHAREVRELYGWLHTQRTCDGIEERADDSRACLLEGRP